MVFVGFAVWAVSQGLFASAPSVDAITEKPVLLEEENKEKDEEDTTAAEEEFEKNSVLKVTFLCFIPRLSIFSKSSKDATEIISNYVHENIHIHVPRCGMGWDGDFPGKSDETCSVQPFRCYLSVCGLSVVCGLTRPTPNTIFRARPQPFDSYCISRARPQLPSLTTSPSHRDIISNRPQAIVMISSCDIFF
jgi:hypothetical protein